MRGRQRRARQNGAAGVGVGTELTVLYCRGVWGPRQSGQGGHEP